MAHEAHVTCLPCSSWYSAWCSSMVRVYRWSHTRNSGLNTGISDRPVCTMLRWDPGADTDMLTLMMPDVVLWQINSISWFHLVSYPGLMCPGWRRRKLRLGLTIWCRDYQETADTARHRLQWSHNTGEAEGFYPRDGLMECNVHVVWWCLKHIEFNWSSLQLFA